MSKKQCFTNEVLERYGRTITRVQAQYKSIADQQRQNANDITTLIKNLSRLTQAQDSDESLRRGRKTLNNKTTLQFAKEVLARAQRPLTLAEIVTRMEEQGWMTCAYAKSATVAQHLYSNPNLFQIAERGKFVLQR